MIGGAEHKQHPFLIHAGSVDIICVLFLFLASVGRRKEHP